VDHSIFDNRNYPIVNVEHGYGEWAQTYEEIVQDAMDIRLFNRIMQVDWRGHQHILDLACGTGRIGVWLREQTDAVIDGVDITREMMEQAQAKGVYRTLHHASITDTGLPNAHYDLCTQSLADEHLPDLGPLYAEVFRLMKPQGKFVIVGFHPYFLMLGMPTHYTNPTGEDITIQSYVHLLSDHVKAAYAAGWSLVAMDEGVIDDEYIEYKPKWKKHYGIPISFCMIWQKDG
jgi:SAM-dependent methyltransferase